MMNAFKTGIDNYGLFPLYLNSFEVLEWTHAQRGEGVHFSGLSQEQGRSCSREELIDLAQCAASYGMYLEWGGGQHVPFDTDTWREKDIFSLNKKAAEQAEILGTRIVRSCSGGLFRWQPDSPDSDTLLEAVARSLRAQKEMLRDHNAILSIETHFEFTTFELARLFDMCGAEPGDYLGICLDTMNPMILMEDPLAALERILPWIVCTHMKDGGLVRDTDGISVYPCELGRGVVPFEEIIVRLAGLERRVNLSVEDHGGDFRIPINDEAYMSKLPDLTSSELARLVQAAGSAEKKGFPSPVSRDDWAAVCEDRMKMDLSRLQAIVRSIGNQSFT